MKKRFLCLILVLCVALSGCSFFTEGIREPVQFYYLCDSYQEELCCVIVSEEREASGHISDLSYLLALYLMGPTNDELVMPLPTGTRITAQQDNGTLFLELSDLSAVLSDIDFSLACACLTMTCLEITDAEQITIRSGDRVNTMDRGSLTLSDATTTDTPTEETS